MYIKTKINGIKIYLTYLFEKFLGSKRLCEGSKIKVVLTTHYGTIKCIICNLITVSFYAVFGQYHDHTVI